MMTSIAPFWDGNETWLVLGGGGLWVAFPHAYAVDHAGALSAGDRDAAGAGVPRRRVRIPLGRGDQQDATGTSPSPAARRSPAFCQGVILGGLIQGITVENGAFAGGTFDWATPFALLCGLGVVAGYALLGATWLVMKTEGAGRRARARAGQAAAARACSASWRVVSLWTPLAFPRIARALVLAAEHSFTSGRCRSITALTAFAAWRWLDSGRDIPPFLAAIALFLLGYLGLVISSFPYLVPPSLTIWETAAAPASQIFMLIGTLVLLPIILGYTVLRLLAVPRQGAGRRRLSLSTDRPRRCSRRARPDHAPADRAVSGRRPWKRRSNARGTSATRSGNAAVIAGGGGRRVSVAGQTTTAPLSAMSCGVTHGDSAGAWSRNTRLGRLGAASATSEPPCTCRRRRSPAAGRCGARSSRRRTGPSRRPAARP